MLCWRSVKTGRMRRSQHPTLFRGMARCKIPVHNVEVAPIGAAELLSHPANPWGRLLAKLAGATAKSSRKRGYFGTGRTPGGSDGWHRRGKSSVVQGYPVAGHGVQDHQQLPHISRQRDLGRLSHALRRRRHTLFRGLAECGISALCWSWDSDLSEPARGRLGHR